VLDESTLVWPEYRGNGQFSTQGNLKAYSGASILLPFCDGSIFQIVGTALCKYAEGVCVDQQDIECHFFVQKVVETTGLALQWNLVSNSGMSHPVIGGYEGINVELDRELSKPPDASDLSAADGAAKAEVVRLRALLRNLKESEFEECNGKSRYNTPTKKLVKIRKGKLCAPGIKSYVVDSEGAFEMMHKPGQYINLLLASGRNRYWTISGSPELLSSNSKVEITVKLEPEGRGGSKELYDIDSEGLTAEVLGIDGEMCVDLFQEHPRKKMLFLSSGIGITPFLCIARGLAAAHAARMAKCNLDVLMLHSTRGLDAMPYLQELRSIVLRSPDWQTDSSFRLLVLDTAHKDGQSTQIAPDVRHGRCTATVLTDEVPDITERHVCICGSTNFTKAQLAALEMIGVPQSQIQTEAFDF